MKEYYTEIERLELIISALTHGSQKEFARVIGIPQSTLSRILSGELRLKSKIDKIVSCFPIVSRDWLSTGLGYPGDLSVDIMKEHYTSIIKDKDDTISILARELSLQQEVIAKLTK